MTAKWKVFVREMVALDADGQIPVLKKNRENNREFSKKYRPRGKDKVANGGRS